MSDFYAQRRTSIKDAIALCAFIIGWFASAPFAWPYIREGFEDGGSAAGGVLRFLVVVFAVGIASGGGGLALGAAIGSAWERYHRRTRNVHVEELTPTGHVPDASEIAAKRAVLTRIRFANSGVDPAEFHELALRLGYAERERDRVVRAMQHSINIGAWDGDRLVGAARVLTDGHLSAALADIFVESESQRKGIGRELMTRAFNATPRGTLLIVAGNHSSAFFHGIGCERTMAGYVMRKPARGADPSLRSG